MSIQNHISKSWYLFFSSLNTNPPGAVSILYAKYSTTTWHFPFTLARETRKKKGSTYTLLGSSLKVNLICTNTETTNSQQVMSFVQDFLGELCLGTNTNDMNITNLLNKFITNQSLAISFDLYVQKKKPPNKKQKNSVYRRITYYIHSNHVYIFMI